MSMRDLSHLTTYSIKIDEDDETTGMSLIAFVEKPAMEVQAVKLSEAVAPLSLKSDEYKQYLTSAVIIPDKPIYRNDPKRGEYLITFSAEDIEKIRNKFFKSSGNLKLSNKNHDSSDSVAAVLVESWIIEDEKMDKAVALGFTGLPKGTMLATYKILDDSFWQDEVLTGNVTGFSLEGLFHEVETQLSQDQDPLYALLEEMVSLLESRI